MGVDLNFVGLIAIFAILAADRAIKNPILVSAGFDTGHNVSVIGLAADMKWILTRSNHTTHCEIY